VFGEVLTAVVTPFDGSGAVDHDRFRDLAAFLVEHGSDGLVVAGTTGEAPTLSDDERLELIAAAVDAVGDRATVIAGTGTYSTSHSVHLTEQAHELGVDGFPSSPLTTTSRRCAGSSSISRRSPRRATSRSSSTTFRGGSC